MNSSAENHARNLQKCLAEHFSDQLPATEMLLSEADSHWHLWVRRGASECVTDCLDAWGPQYLTYFRRNGETAATGRTSLRDDTASAISDWVAGHQLSQLYSRFRFVDFAKRRLTRMQQEVFSRCSELQGVAQSDLHHVSDDKYYLWFRRNQRSCRLVLYGMSSLPEATFFWENSELFHFAVNDRLRLAEVLSRWLGDWAMPSSLRLEFTWLAIDEHADDYELDTPVEGEFRESWIRLERFYSDDKVPFARQARRFIVQIRQRGYDKLLRAGQSLENIIVSRSRKHGLRDNQPWMSLCFGDDGMELHATLDGQSTTIRTHAELTPEVENWLKSLVARGVD